MILYLLLALVLAMFIVAAGVYFRSKASAQDVAVRWLQFLFFTTALSLGLTILLSNPLHYLGPFLMPIVIGTLAGFLFSLANRRFWPTQHFKATLFYALGIGILLILLAVVSYSEFIYLTFPALVLALTWKAWESQRLGRLLVLLFLLMIMVSESDVVPSALSIQLPETFRTFAEIAMAFWPVAAVAAAARLVHSVFAADRAMRWWKVGLGLVLAGFLLLTVVYQILVALPWDAIMDGLAVAMISWMASVAAIGAAMLLAWSFSGRRRWIAPGFALVVLVSMTYASDAWAQVSPVTLTEQRAEQVNQAIRRYQAENGTFPIALVDLSPRYLWRIPEPIMLQGTTWCYEGGNDHYRLGYFFHDRFDGPASVRIQDAAGTPPNTEWKCERDVANYNRMLYCGYTMNRTGCPRGEQAP